MPKELHKLCNTAMAELQNLFSDTVHPAPYLQVMSETKEEAGRRIKAARLRLDMRLEDVCSQIPGLTVSRLSNWEQGRNMVGVDEAKKLAPVLGVSAAYLLTLDDDTGDQREQALIALYRSSDTRGKETIFRVAESESTYIVSSDAAPRDDKAA